MVLLWLCCNSLACIKPLQPQNDAASSQSDSHKRLGFRFERIPEGVLVVYVAKNMGAEVSGLQVGDIVFSANGASGEDLIAVLQDRSQDYVHLDVQPKWSNDRRTLVVQRGIGSAIESPTVDPLLKFAATDNLEAAKTVWKEGSYHSDDVVTSLRLIGRNYPQHYMAWLDAVRELVPVNTQVLSALMQGYNDQGQFDRVIEVHEAWTQDVGWDVWTDNGAVYTHTNLQIEKELVHALMELEDYESARDRVRELQRWHGVTDLERIVGLDPREDTTVIWSDKKPTFEQIPGVDVQGNPWSIEDNAWTVLAFWATWCAPCKKEIPELNEWSLLGPDVTILAVNVDDKIDSDGVLKALKKMGATNLQGIQSADLLSKVGVDAIPTLVLLDSNGTERYRMIGYSPETILNMESKMHLAPPRVKLAHARNMNVEWYPKPTLTDVLYDGEQLWLLDDQKIKKVETLTGWVEGRDIETIIDASDLSENNPAERLIQRGVEVGTVHNSGRILRFVQPSGNRVVSFEESIFDWYTSDNQFWVWGETALKSMYLEQELQKRTLTQDQSPTLPTQHVDTFPLYKDDTLIELTNTEALPISTDILRWNISAFSATTLLGHDVMQCEESGSIQWFLRRHPLSQNRANYSLIALDPLNTPLAVLSINQDTPRLVSGYPSKKPNAEAGSDIEDGKGMWLVIPKQGLLHLEIATLQPLEIDRR